MRVGKKLPTEKCARGKSNRRGMRAVEKLPAEQCTQGRITGKNLTVEQCAQVLRFIFLPARISAGPRAFPLALAHFRG